MAEMIKFLRGKRVDYLALKAENKITDGTLYFCTDGALYLGSNLVAEINVTDEGSVEALIQAALTPYYTKVQVDALIKEIKDDYLKAADKTELEGKITTAQNKANDAYALADAAQTAEEVSAAITSAINALNIDQYTTEAEVLTAINTAIAGVSDTDTINSIAELVNYLNTHGAEAAKMAAAIATLEGKVDVEKVSTAIATALQEAKDYADRNDADTKYDDTEVRGLIAAIQKDINDNREAWEKDDDTIYDDKAIKERLDVLEAIDHDAYKAADETTLNSAKSYTDGKIAEEVTRANGAYDAKGAASAVQGATSATVEDCVKALNIMNNKASENAETVKALTSDVINVVEMLTWGDFPTKE